METIKPIVYELLQCSLSSSQTCNRNTEGRAGHVVQTNVVAELNGRGVTAVLTADEIAANADFFCFGTNDLTQMTYGFSRDDAGKFLGAYYDAKIFENDPFAKLDQTGVGKLMDMAIKLGKPANNNLHVGICGEHGGDPTSVEFCHELGLDYVSCSPFRVPIARLAAAQAALKD